MTNINIVRILNQVFITLNGGITLGSSVCTDEMYAKLQEARLAGDEEAIKQIIDPAYVGLDDKTIRLRLVVNSSDGEPSFALQIVKEELLRNEIVQEFKEKVIALLPENPVRIGTFSA